MKICFFTPVPHIYKSLIHANQSVELAKPCKDTAQAMLKCFSLKRRNKYWVQMTLAICLFTTFVLRKRGRQLKVTSYDSPYKLTCFENIFLLYKIEIKHGEISRDHGCTFHCSFHFGFRSDHFFGHLTLLSLLR